MTGQIIGRMIILFVSLGLILVTGMWAEELPPVTAAEELTPSELYRDVMALRLVRTLKLTPTQMAKIIPVLERVTTQQVADTQADEAAWTVVSQAAQTVIQALLEGRQPPRAEMALFEQVAAERARREAFRVSLAAEAAVQIQRMLTAEQARKIETRVEQEQRKRLEAQLEGAPTPVDYIIQKLDEQVELMPDEYIRLRESRALEMTRTLLGPDDPRRRDFAMALLGIMNEVQSWTAAEYAAQKPMLRERISQQLNLPLPVSPHEITYDEFISWITSNRSAPVLAELLRFQAGGTTEPTLQEEQ
ncbi:MAG: hypothetical protein ACUVX8_05285 [Candidatus Zipacnadales bacterium]